MIVRKASTGNVSGLGWPGANEMMPGFSMSALMRRMAEKRMPRAALEKRWSQAVATFSVIPISSSRSAQVRGNAAVYDGLPRAQARPPHRTFASNPCRAGHGVTGGTGPAHPVGRARAGGSTIAWT